MRAAYFRPGRCRQDVDDTPRLFAATAVNATPITPSRREKLAERLMRLSAVMRLDIFIRAPLTFLDAILAFMIGLMIQAATPRRLGARRAFTMRTRN